jgi:drug/metabolite transporter (DMT)-like permease
MNRTRKKQITRVALTIRLIVYLGIVVIAFAFGARWPWYIYLGIGVMVLVSVLDIRRGESRDYVRRGLRRPQNY